MVDKRTHFGGDRLAAAYSPATWDDTPLPRPAVTKMLPVDDPLLAEAAKIPTEYLLLSEIALEEIIRGKKDGQFERTLGLVKISFWDEYARAIHTKTSMKMKHVWEPLTNQSWWVKNVLQNKLHLAWLLTPPADEIVVQREMLQVGYKKLRDALDLPLMEKAKGFEIIDGVRKMVLVEKPNIPLLKEMHAIVKTLSDRVHGAVTQRHQIMSKNVNVNANVPATPKQVAVIDDMLPELGLKGHDITLAQLEEYENKLLSIEGKIKDVVVLSGESLDEETETPPNKKRVGSLKPETSGDLS